MTTPYTDDAFSYRVNFAAAVMLRGGRTTRSFDTCFEMYDGDEVAAALWRRAQKNPKLSEVLPRYINAEMAKADAERLAGKNLPEEARKSREKARREFAEFIAERDRRQAAKVTP